MIKEFIFFKFRYQSSIDCKSGNYARIASNSFVFGHQCQVIVVSKSTTNKKKYDFILNMYTLVLSFWICTMFIQMICLDIKFYIPKDTTLFIKRYHANVGFRNRIHTKTLTYKSQFKEHYDCKACLFHS